MPEPESIDGVRYHAVDATYFEKRGLRKYAGVWSLWALGVGAVISGDFFGWNTGGAYSFGRSALNLRKKPSPSATARRAASRRPA